MTLEGSVDEYLSKQKTCRIPNIYEYPVTREKDDLKKKFLSEENEIFGLACWRNVLFQLSC